MHEGTGRADMLPEGWHGASDELRAMAASDLDAGHTPTPTLTAYVGELPFAVVGLRPFGPGEATQPLIEALSLLLPLGVDRLGLSLPGRAWSPHDPIAPVTDGVDLRQPVVIIALADGTEHPCRVSSVIHPVEIEGASWRWLAPIRADATPGAPVLHALQVLLDGRDGLVDPDDAGTLLAAQFARVLLRGHQVALSPRAAQDLEALSARP